MQRDLAVTPIIKVNSLCQEFNLPNLYVKDESKNPFGTFKDRRSKLIVREAKKRRVTTLILITAGNAGYSLARSARGTKLKIICVVDNKLSSSTYHKLKAACYKVIRQDLSKRILNSREIIQLAKTNSEEKIWDVTNGWERAYENIIKELRRSKPNYIITPVGSGESYIGLYHGLKKYNLKAKLIGVSPKAHNSLANKLHTNWTPYKRKLEVITKKDHRLLYLTESEIRQSYRLAKTALRCEPSSAIVCGALKRLKLKSSQKVVIINSGASI